MNEINVLFLDVQKPNSEFMPALPKLTKSIISPSNTKVKLVITDSTYKDIPNVMVAPSKGNISRDQDPAKIPFTYGTVYDKNQFFPGNLAEVGNSYTLRKYNGVPIIVYPLQYNPVTKVLRVYTSITVEARFEANSSIAAMGPEQSLSGLDGIAHFIAASGSYSVEATAPGYQDSNLSSMDINSINASAISIAMVPNQNNLTIIVIDTHTSTPMVNATVTINGQTYYTNATGEVVVTLYSGRHTVTVSADNHAQPNLCHTDRLKFPPLKIQLSPEVLTYEK